MKRAGYFRKKAWRSSSHSSNGTFGRRQEAVLDRYLEHLHHARANFAVVVHLFHFGERHGARLDQRARGRLRLGVDLDKHGRGRRRVRAAAGGVGVGVGARRKHRVARVRRRLRQQRLDKRRVARILQLGVARLGLHRRARRHLGRQAAQRREVRAQARAEQTDES